MTASTETPDWTGQQIAYSYGGDLIKLSTTIAAAIRAAVVAERDACAKVAETLFPATSKKIAAAIRSRGAS